MKLLAKNGDYCLYYAPDKVNRYAVYHIYSSSPSEDLKIIHMVAQSSIFSKRLKSYFTLQQVNTALAKVHAIRYANQKFKV